MRSILAAVLLAASPAAAQITVTSAADVAANDGACTLRESIVAANTDTASGAAAGSGADTVTLALAPSTVIAMTSHLPTIIEALTIDRGGAVVDGADAFRLVDFDPVPAGETITLRRLTLQRGRASAGGAILVAGFSAPATAFTLEQSTISGNTAESSGGGIVQIGSFAASTLRGVTVTGNALTGTSGGGGGISFDHTLSLQSTIVAGNTSARDAVWGDLSFGTGTATSLGGNLIGVNGFFATEFPAGAPNASGDLVGTAAAPLAPGLGPLAAHGGPTPTHLLLSTSPALDAGRCAGAATDQRGAPRELGEPGAPNQGGDACDVGAVEGTAPFVGLDAPPEAGAALGAPFPSPAGGDSAVRVAVDRPQALRLVLVDVLGREVARVLDGPLAAGDHRVHLPTVGLAAGVYVLRLDGAGWTATRTLAVVR